MEKCPLCGGDKKQGNTTYTVDLGFGVVVVRGVPAKVCTQCGEEWIDARVAKQLEEIVNSTRNKQPQLEVIPFQKV